MPAPSCFSGLGLFLTVYVSLFAVASVVLFGSLYEFRGKNGRRVSESQRSQGQVSEHGRLSTRYYVDGGYRWQNELHKNRSSQHAQLRGAQEQVLQRWPYSNTGVVNCTSLHNMTDLEFLAGGWTKSVYRGRLGSTDVAIKTVNLNGHDIQECQKRGGSLPLCYRRAAAKILKEIILLTELAHNNIVKVLGSCVPDAVGPVSMVTELGDPLDTVRLLQLSWEDRLRLALGMAHILHHLAHSPLGSLSMNDFRRQQFVLVAGTLKLSDVDDIGVNEPRCELQMDCQLQLARTPDLNVSVTVPCVQGHCHGHNEKLNIWHAGKHFIQLFLPLSAPASLEPHIQELLQAYQTVRWDTTQILAATQRLVASFISGDYLHPDSTTPGIHNLGFEKLQDSDLPGMYDYRCLHSISAVGCVLSVFDEVEAAEICAKDTECKAVVLGQDHTWTGRTLAVFKNGFGPPTVRMGYSLLLRKT